MSWPTSDHAILRHFVETMWNYTVALTAYLLTMSEVWILQPRVFHPISSLVELPGHAGGILPPDTVDPGPSALPLGGFKCIRTLGKLACPGLLFAVKVLPKERMKLIDQMGVSATSSKRAALSTLPRPGSTSPILCTMSTDSTASFAGAVAVIDVQDRTASSIEGAHAHSVKDTKVMGISPP
ncbi:hypothetical protein BDR04DRAFT_1119895 [Suillus decipiens]|nr:hypothetical protein BDR04DRAFT_1119895 [Suillus decipiens]